MKIRFEVSPKHFVAPDRLYMSIVSGKLAHVSHDAPPYVGVLNAFDALELVDATQSDAVEVKLKTADDIWVSSHISCEDYLRFNLCKQEGCTVFKFVYGCTALSDHYLVPVDWIQSPQMYIADIHDIAKGHVYQIKGYGAVVALAHGHPDQDIEVGVLDKDNLELGSLGKLLNLDSSPASLASFKIKALGRELLDVDRKIAINAAKSLLKQSSLPNNITHTYMEAWPCFYNTDAGRWSVYSQMLLSALGQTSFRYPWSIFTDFPEPGKRFISRKQAIFHISELRGNEGDLTRECSSTLLKLYISWSSVYSETGELAHRDWELYLTRPNGAKKLHSQEFKTHSQNDELQFQRLQIIKEQAAKFLKLDLENLAVRVVVTGKRFNEESQLADLGMSLERPPGLPRVYVEIAPSVP